MLTFAIPTWNRVDKLRVCIESILVQIRECGEVVKIAVYNNASDDGTHELLEWFKKNYPDVIDYENGADHVRGQESFKRAFLLPKTEWFWMFGDDDFLAPNGLKNIIDILKRKNVDFIHAAEATRANGENRTFYATTLELCNGFGFVEMTGFISGNICRTKQFQEVLNSDDCALYQDCSYFQSLAILDAFSNSKAAFVNAPVVDLQNRTQTNETCERWNKEDVSLHYADIGRGLIRLLEKGAIYDELPDDFFRYLSVNMFTKILYNFYEYASNKREFIGEKHWKSIDDLASLTKDKEGLKEKIKGYKESLDEYVRYLKKSDDYLLKIQEKHDVFTTVLYPQTYV